MVAFYLSNTGKILVGFIITLIIISCKCGSIFKENDAGYRDINQYMDIELQLSSDTVKEGDSLTVNVLFKNKTDTLLEFYPKSFMFLAKPFIAFDAYQKEYASYILNDTLDFGFTAKIKARSIFVYVFKVKVNSLFFGKGNNTMHLYYSCPVMKDKNKIYNKFCGHLISPDIVLVVKP